MGAAHCMLTAVAPSPVHSHRGALGELGQATGQTDDRRLRRAVADHLQNEAKARPWVTQHAMP